jgi:hypothetical protein
MYWLIAGVNDYLVLAEGSGLLFEKYFQTAREMSLTLRIFYISKTSTCQAGGAGWKSVSS